MAEKKKTTSPSKEKHDIILEYLEGQRDIVLEAMQKIEEPITPDTSPLELERTKLRWQLYDLQSHIKTIKLLING